MYNVEVLMYNNIHQNIPRRITSIKRGRHDASTTRVQRSRRDRRPAHVPARHPDIGLVGDHVRNMSLSSGASGWFFHFCCASRVSSPGCLKAPALGPASALRPLPLSGLCAGAPGRAPWTARRAYPGDDPQLDQYPGHWISLQIEAASLYGHTVGSSTELLLA